MSASFGITLGWRGFGFTRAALIPELRLGIVSVWWCRGAITDRVHAVICAARMVAQHLAPRA